ncbi:extracellular matrix protein 3 [Caerostris extrusa]|uniref:Extracellular matrix protein 3 n=1 Tax=Caerostris extrusa TaxID=172846 RepID=A0AAV4NNB2_CAEEX|nr:extracellular matrix protein 3 [Caerostris extrusa]
MFEIRLEISYQTKNLQFCCNQWTTNHQSYITKGIDILENGFVVITPDILDVTDEDTDPGLLTFSVTEKPKHGTLQIGTLQMSNGDSFTKLDINSGIVSYSNGGSEADSDSFNLYVTDGVHIVPVTVHVSIKNIDDEAPKLEIAHGILSVILK